MAFTPSRFVCFLLVLFAAGQRIDALCTEEEMTSLFQCITPYNQQFFQAIGVDDSTCNRTKITSEICTSFVKIVNCIKPVKLSAENCVPGVAAQINANMGIPCKVEDFFAVCTDAPAIWNFGGKTTKKPDSGDGKGNGSDVRKATSFLWMTSLIASFLVVMLASESR